MITSCSASALAREGIRFETADPEEVASLVLATIFGTVLVFVGILKILTIFHFGRLTKSSVITSVGSQAPLCIRHLVIYSGPLIAAPVTAAVRSSLVCAGIPFGLLPFELGIFVFLFLIVEV